MKKKNLLIGGMVLIGFIGLIGVIGLVGKGKDKNLAKGGKPTPSPAQVLQELSADQLPLVRLIPRADKREVTLEIKNIKNADSVEYELSYLSKGLSRGVVGTIQLKGETSVSRKILLGTCSRNVCKYDEGITDGQLTLRLRSSEGVIKATAPFDLDSKDYQLQLQGWIVK